MSYIKCEYHPDATLIEDYRAGTNWDISCDFIFVWIILGDVICTECGLVVGDRCIDVSRQWRSCDMFRVGDVTNSLPQAVSMRAFKKEYVLNMTRAERALANINHQIGAIVDRVNISPYIYDRYVR